jgi:hypothetical protein
VVLARARQRLERCRYSGLVRHTLGWVAAAAPSAPVRRASGSAPADCRFRLRRAPGLTRRRAVVARGLAAGLAGASAMAPETFNGGPPGRNSISQIDYAIRFAAGYRWVVPCLSTPPHCYRLMQELESMFTVASDAPEGPLAEVVSENSHRAWSCPLEVLA